MLFPWVFSVGFRLGGLEELNRYELLPLPSEVSFVLLVATSMAAIRPKAISAIRECTGGWKQRALGRRRRRRRCWGHIRSVLFAPPLSIIFEYSSAATKDCFQTKAYLQSNTSTTLVNSDN